MSTADRPRLGHVMKLARERAGLPLEDLAAQVGVGTDDLRGAEESRHALNLGHELRIQRALGVRFRCSGLGWEAVEREDGAT